MKLGELKKIISIYDASLIVSVRIRNSGRTIKTYKQFGDLVLDNELDELIVESNGGFAILTKLIIVWVCGVK